MSFQRPKSLHPSPESCSLEFFHNHQGSRSQFGKLPRSRPQCPGVRAEHFHLPGWLGTEPQPGASMRHTMLSFLMASLRYHPLRIRPPWKSQNLCLGFYQKDKNNKDMEKVKLLYRGRERKLAQAHGQLKGSSPNTRPSAP